MSGKEEDKHVFSYMDGIPVKISEKYKPPRKVVLPVGFHNRLLQPPVSPDYDFQLEHDILDKLQLWRNSRAMEKERRKQRIADEDAERQKLQETMQELKKTMNELSTRKESPTEEQSSPTPSPVPAAIIVQSIVKAQPAVPLQSSVGSPGISEGNPILRPVPFKHHVVSSQINNNKPMSAFNLSDFEADTSSPFDNMELKTINDLEELAQVLQPSTVKQLHGYYQSTSLSDESFGNMHQLATSNSQVPSIQRAFNLASSNEVLNDVKCDGHYQHHMNGFASNFDYNSMQSYHPQTVIPNLNPHGQAVAYHVAERELSTQPSVVPYAYSHQDTHQQLQNYYSTNAWPSSTYQQARTESTTYGNITGTEVNSASQVPAYTVLSASSSLDQAEERSSEDDAESSVSYVAQQLSDLMKSRAFKIHPKASEESTPENSSSVQSPSSPVESDPFEKLPLDSQLLVRKIAEMGFPRARVARACQNLGINDKKIIEFLLSLQSLLDAGYQEGHAEHALSLVNQDVNAALKFLQVESQLLDLGFSADRVSEALLKFNCDRDQALEFLIS